VGKGEYSADLENYQRQDSKGNDITKVIFSQTFSEKAHQRQLEQALNDLMISGEYVNDRRQGLNNYFLSINSALLGAIGWVISTGLPHEARSAIILCVSGFGLTLCRLWLQLLKAYLGISKSKIAIVEELEDKAAVRPFTAQYELGKANSYPGLNILESKVAQAFLIAHCVIGIISVIALIGILAPTLGRWFSRS